jgi:tRNA-dihydrouridine synthase B
VDFITLHGRYAKLSFRRKADWNLVKFLKNNLSIPVIGNGDILKPEDAAVRLNETGCDGIMIGREGVKSPWIFALAEGLIHKGFYSLRVDLFDVFSGVMKELEKNLPHHLHKSRGHRFCFYYCKNFIFAHDIFKKIRNVDRINDMIDVLEEYLYRNPHEKVKIFHQEK